MCSQYPHCVTLPLSQHHCYDYLYLCNIPTITTVSLDTCSLPISSLKCYGVWTSQNVPSRSADSTPCSAEWYCNHDCSHGVIHRDSNCSRGPIVSSHGPSPSPTAANKQPSLLTSTITISVLSASLLLVVVLLVIVCSVTVCLGVANRKYRQRQREQHHHLEHVYTAHVIRMVSYCS